MQYDALHQILRSLEAQVGMVPYGGLPLPAPVRGSLSPVQGFALANDTAGLDLPVVVAIGANYTQGKEETPRDVFATASAVEDDLKSCRRRVNDALGALNANWVATAKASHPSASLRSGYHLVMTNFCLWNTTERWQKIDRTSRAGLLANNPSFNGGETRTPTWRHLMGLHAALASAVPLWIAHGIHSEVFSLFQAWAALVGFERWMMTPNLSYPYRHYGRCFPRL